MLNLKFCCKNTNIEFMFLTICSFVQLLLPRPRHPRQLIPINPPLISVFLGFFLCFVIEAKPQTPPPHPSSFSPFVVLLQLHPRHPPPSSNFSRLSPLFSYCGSAPDTPTHLHRALRPGRRRYPNPWSSDFCHSHFSHSNLGWTPIRSRLTSWRFA